MLDGLSRHGGARRLAHGPGDHAAQAGTNESVRARARAPASPHPATTPLHVSDSAPAVAVYGPDLQEAVKRFQRRHGLTDDGVRRTRGRGRDERAGRSANPANRAEHGAVAMAAARARRSPHSRQHPANAARGMGPRLHSGARCASSSESRIRKLRSSTTRMTYLVFAPILERARRTSRRNETLPVGPRRSGLPEPHEHGSHRCLRQARRPARASICRARRSIASVSGPGTSNALGLVKFMFPNQFNVYLHDTPADSLFARASRSFSHGCVRLEQPEKLAEYVLRDQPEWTADRIIDAMHARRGDDRQAEGGDSRLSGILDGASHP